MAAPPRWGARPCHTSADRSSPRSRAARRAPRVEEAGPGPDLRATRGEELVEEDLLALAERGRVEGPAALAQVDRAVALDEHVLHHEALGDRVREVLLDEREVAVEERDRDEADRDGKDRKS